tara:strand:- start:390 stop:713 length:324 start_codon:yes stop_codon:yes gene_type:complete
MGFFSSLGKRISSAAHSLGQKYGKVVRKGVKFVADHASAFKKGADVVGNIAGMAASGAAAMGMAPVAGVLGGVAAGAKVAGKIAGVAGAAARGAVAADKIRKQIQRK